MSAQVSNDNLPLRKRGRPSGKHRVPLSLEQRRARNAQYERERRNETAEAMAQLAEAAGCEPNMSNADLLMTVINRLQEAAEIKSTEDIEDLKRINNNLMSQIETLENRLNNDRVETYSRECSDLTQQTTLCASSERPAIIHQHKERTKNPKKKIKLNTEARKASDDPLKWTSNAATKTQIKPELQRQNQHRVKMEVLDQLDSQANSTHAGFESDQYRSPTEPGIEELRETDDDQTNSQPGPSISIVQEYPNPARSPDYFTRKQSRPYNRIAQAGSEARTSRELSSNTITNHIQTAVTQEMQNEYEMNPVFDFFTDNERGLFDDIEWLNESEQSVPSAQNNEIPETARPLDLYMITEYL